MYFDEDKFSVDTPTGKEYCIVQDLDYLEDLSLYKTANEVFYKAVQEREIPPEYWVDEFKKKMRFQLYIFFGLLAEQENRK